MKLCGGGVASDYDLIATTTLTSNQAQIDFENLRTIAADYKHIQVRWVARTNRADYQDQLAIRVNNQTTAYNSHTLYGNGSSAQASQQTNFNMIISQSSFDLFSANENSNYYGFGIVDIFDFSSTIKTPVVKMISSAPRGTQANHLNLTGGFKDAQTDLFKLSFLSRNGASFTSGSRFSLYGIKG